MSDRAARKASGWTVDTLKDHIEALLADKNVRDQQRWEATQMMVRDMFIAQEKAVGASLLAAQMAVQKAEVAAEKRFDAANEFRGQLSDQAQTFMPRREYQVQHDALVDRVLRIEAQELLDAGGHAKALDIRGAVLAVCTLVVAATAVLIGVILR